MHQNAFIFVVPCVALLTIWMQKSLKIVENSPNVSATSIFPVSKTLQKMMKIMHVDVLEGPFVDGDQASRRVSKIVQNDIKMHLKSPQKEHKR